ncbi:glycosyltransferase [Chitinispirillales bacterium ANBcel5]|uniref:glycosyltransferase n=1 Tax=Cellulosispirillum alkaliphilum TaxID=3039283 RepID=UPI002A587CAC|nr:glycosyltransferase [Chitinispirillales bacterium ANBcel5]
MVALVIVCTLYVLCSLILLSYGIQCYVLTYLFLRKRKEKISSQRKTFNYYYQDRDESEYPLVVTQLPMYNEKLVACRVIEAAAKMEYPRSRHQIQVLDDSTDETVGYVDKTVSDLREKGYNVEIIRREDRTGFKAGALQNGLDFTDAEFVAIFDADFVPTKDFLKKSMAFFVDKPQLGLVQGRWTHLNKRESLITRGQAMGIDGHFMIEQAARSWNGLFMNFNGTAGVFRRKAIETSGGWQHDTLTEDMDLSYRMQLAGWKTEYVPDLEVPAEIPEDINAFKNQQFRWAKGSIQTAMKIIPLLWKKRMPVFKLLQAIFHLTHYVVHPLMFLLAVLTMPVLFYVKVFLPPFWFGCIVFAMILATSGPSTMYMVSQYYVGNKIRKQIFLIPALMLIGTGLAVNNGKAVLEALFKLKSPFHRTPKKGQSAGKQTYKPIKDLTCIVEILLGVYCLISFRMFLGYTNFLVSPFLVLYASGFLFVGVISIIHFRRPELIDIKLPLLKGS